MSSRDAFHSRSFQPSEHIRFTWRIFFFNKNGNTRSRAYRVRISVLGLCCVCFKNSADDPDALLRLRIWGLAYCMVNNVLLTSFLDSQLPWGLFHLYNTRHRAFIVTDFECFVVWRILKSQSSSREALSPVFVQSPNWTACRCGTQYILQEELARWLVPRKEKWGNSLVK